MFRDKETHNINFPNFQKMTEIEIVKGKNILEKEFNELKGKSDYLLIKNPKERKAFLINELKNLKESKNVVDDSIININQDINP